jgi:hypothetical protein
MSNTRWIVSFPLLCILGCASAPAPAPIEPPPAEPVPPAPATASGTSSRPMATPPPAGEPPVASAPPVVLGADPSPVPPPNTARSTQASVRTAPKSASTTKPAPSSPPPAAAASGSAPSYNGPDPCKLAVDGDSPVDKACREGGIKSAKTAMKALLKDARANGARFDCDDCHINEEDYAQLSQGTDEKFAKLLAAARK